jgi:hypothetical protein
MSPAFFYLSQLTLRSPICGQIQIKTRHESYCPMKKIYGEMGGLPLHLPHDATSHWLPLYLAWTNSPSKCEALHNPSVTSSVLSGALVSGLTVQPCGRTALLFRRIWLFLTAGVIKIEKKSYIPQRLNLSMPVVSTQVSMLARFKISNLLSIAAE